MTIGPPNLPIKRIWILALLPALGLTGRAADSPEVQLPPPAAIKIDFDRDIRPVFQTSCVRCHGPEKPRSHFRLDSRQAALKGGSDGIDILPGRSADSPLIQRVASSDENEEMPPPDKGDLLSTAQIARLRAWIDQGANWGAPEPPARPTLTVESQFDAIGVHGDKGKFREIEGVKDGVSGGLKQFVFEEQISPDESFSLQGHSLSAGQDFALTLDWKKNGVGSINAGFEQWRHYEDNFGGFVTPPGIPSAGSLALDEGRAWVEFRLTPPEGPQITLGFEEQYRQGNEASLDWGGAIGPRVTPTTETVDEHTHIIKLDVSDEWAGWRAEDNARLEIHRQNDQTAEASIANNSFNTQNKYQDVQGMNTLMVEKQVSDWWLLSAGYCYSHLEGDSSILQTGSPLMSRYWEAPQITIGTESHIFSASSLFRPVSSLTLSLDAQNEWTREEGFGPVEVEFPPVTLPVAPIATTEDSNLDKFRASQNAEIRFTQIPWTVLFADARFEHESISEFQQGFSDPAAIPGSSFARQTDAENTLHDLRTGFTISPWRWLSLNAQYRAYSSLTDYHHLLDTDAALMGYPAFILGRTIMTGEEEIKLVLRPANWLRTSLSYKIEGTEFSTTTAPVAGGISPGGVLAAADYHAHTYGVSATLTPVPRLSFTGTFDYSQSLTTSFANNSPSVVPYKGGVYTVTASTAYALTPTADLSATYTFGHSDYAETNGAAGIPLGLIYTRHTVTVGLGKRFSDKVSASIKYAFYTYSEPSSGGLDDYTAQGIFATIAYRWH